MNNYLLGFTYSILFLFILLLLECLTRKNNYNKETTRKIAHILSGLFGAIIGVVLEQAVFITIALIFLLIISVSYGLKFFSSIHDVKRKTYGEILLPLGILLAYMISNGSMVNYITSVLILTVSDPLSGIIGRMSKRKSYYGSVSFFVSALIILLIIFNFQKLILLIFIALTITIVENISSYGTDNATIPLTTSILLKLLL